MKRTKETKKSQSLLTMKVRSGMMMNLMMKMEKKMKVTLNLEIVTHLKEIS
jgi:hypothetical protein